MITTADKIYAVIALLVLAAASPFIYEQATSEPEAVNEQYWAERGYEPLPSPPTTKNKQ